MQSMREASMQEELIKVFVDRLEEYRIKANLTLSGLAQAFHVDRATMSKYRSGKYLPTTDMIVRLAELHGVSVAELLRVDREESIEEKRKRIFLQEIWEVVLRYHYSSE